MTTQILDGPDTTHGVHPDDDPATPEVRRKLMRELLISAIRRYEEALAACRFLDDAYPPLTHPMPPGDDAVKAERRAWGRLVESVDDDFDNAERGLATLIRNLYGDLAMEGDGETIELAIHGPFFERAIRHRGTTYALQYDPRDYEPGTSIIGIVRPGRVFDLAGGDDGDES